jgi:hypothetical protein
MNIKVVISKIAYLSTGKAWRTLFVEKGKHSIFLDNYLEQ